MNFFDRTNNKYGQDNLSVKMQEMYFKLLDMMNKVESRVNSLNRQEYEMSYAIKSGLVDLENRGVNFLMKFKDVYNSTQMTYQNVKHIESDIHEYGSRLEERVEHRFESGFHALEDMMHDFESHVRDLGDDIVDRAESAADNAYDYAQESRGYAEDSLMIRDEVFEYGKSFKDEMGNWGSSFKTEMVNWGSNLESKMNHWGDNFRSEMHTYGTGLKHYGDNLKRDVKEDYDRMIHETDNRLHMMENIGDTKIREMNEAGRTLKDDLQEKHTSFRSFLDNSKKDAVINFQKTQMEHQNQMHDLKSLRSENESMRDRLNWEANRNKMELDAQHIDNTMKSLNEGNKLRQEFSSIEQENLRLKDLNSQMKDEHRREKNLLKSEMKGSMDALLYKQKQRQDWELNRRDADNHERRMEERVRKIKDGIKTSSDHRNASRKLRQMGYEL